MTKNFITLLNTFLFLFFIQTFCFAQLPDFPADRPGLSDAPDLIDKRTWQIATGFDISKYNHYGVYQLSQNTLKYGIHERLEARLDFSYQYDPQKKTYGVSPPALGLKTLLLKQKYYTPKTSFIIEYYPPPFGDTQSATGWSMELCFTHNFKNGNNFYYNAGLNWFDVTTSPAINGLFGFNWQVKDPLNIFTEFYFYKKPSNNTVFVSDIGVTYLLNKRTLIDFATGLNLTNTNGNFYFDGGLTYNF